MKKIVIKLSNRNLSDPENEIFELKTIYGSTLCCITRSEMQNDFPDELYDAYSSNEYYNFRYLKNRPDIVEIKISDESYEDVKMVSDYLNSIGEYEQNNRLKQKSLIEEALSKISVRCFKEKHDPNSYFWS